METTQSILDQLPQNAAAALAGGSCWDYYVGDFTRGTEVIAIMVTPAGAPVIPSPEVQAKWRAMKKVLQRFAVEANEDETVALYRALPARERHIVDDLVRALSARH